MQSMPERDRQWMQRLGSLIYCIQRAKKLQTLSKSISGPLYSSAGAFKQAMAQRSTEAGPDAKCLSRARRELAAQVADAQLGEEGVEWLCQV